MSLKGDKYETVEEITMRLVGTVVLYDGEPVYVTRVSFPDADEVGKKEIARVFSYKLPLTGNNEEHRKYLSSRKFDLTPFKMGYFNYKYRGGNVNHAVYVSRSPVRQNRQGLSKSSAVLATPEGQKATNISFDLALASSGFLDMVNGKYPDFKEASELLSGQKTGSVALSRSFAMTYDDDLEVLYLAHKATKCGIYLDKQLRLPPKFHFLRQEAEECRIPLI